MREHPEKALSGVGEAIDYLIPIAIDHEEAELE